MSSQLNKRSRINSNEEEDRISKLPDPLILHILSFLDAKHVVKTGVLSKRFEDLWTEVTCLSFQNVDMKSVNNTLYLHKLSNLDKISVMDCFIRNKIELSRLIRVLRLACVKDLSLAFQGGMIYALPQHFYSNSSLKKLSLTDWDINTNGNVSWKSLQSLTLSGLVLSDDTIDDVLSGCPSLEELELSNCRDFTWIDMTNNKFLTKLHVNDFFHACIEEVILEITAPNLKSLCFSSAMDCFKFKVLEAESLTNCILDFYMRDYVWQEDSNLVEALTSILNDLSHVEVVSVGVCMLRVLSMIELKGMPCPMSKTVKCLKLSTTFRVNEIVGIWCLLRELTCLEKLSIEMYDYKKHCLRLLPGEEDNEGLNIKANWTSELDLKLKSVKIEDPEADYDLRDDQKPQLFLVKLLLESAKCLEKMRIVANGSAHHLLKLSNKLLGLPKSSPHAVVEIVDSK